MAAGRLKFVQSGDWHLGQAYRNVGPELAERLRGARLEAVGRVLGLAERLGAAFVVVVGDQFDGPRPDPEVVRGMLDRIAAHPTLPVHMIPGNHDPAEPGSAYELGGFKRGAPANLSFHRRAEAVPLPDLGATLYPCPCLARFGENPLAWVPPRGESDGWRIGLAHGSLPGFAEAEGRNYPIPADAPERYDLDYLALGDWHTVTPDPAERPGGRMFYAGAPEVGGWDETGAGSALEVELQPGAVPRVTVHRVGGYDWRELHPEMHTVEDVARLDGELSRLALPTRLVRLKLSGALPESARQKLQEAVEARGTDFAGLWADLTGLALAAEGEIDPPADPLLRAAHARLLRLAADPGDGLPRDLPKDLPPVDVEVVARALARFRALLP